MLDRPYQLVVKNIRMSEILPRTDRAPVVLPSESLRRSLNWSKAKKRTPALAVFPMTIADSPL